MSKNVVIIGGHGKVALRLARLLSPSNNVTSVIRTVSAEQEKDDSGAKDFLDLFTRLEVNAVYFCAGAGYKAEEERVKKVEYEGIVNICDAIESLAEDKRPRFLVISALDIRDPNKVPDHYNDADKKMSERMRTIMPNYFRWRYEADKNLVSRTGFRWTILRPGGLSDNTGAGKVSLGKAHLSVLISRDDLAETLATLLHREDAAGLAIDITGGDVPISEAINAFIAHGVTDWIG